MCCMLKQSAEPSKHLPQFPHSHEDLHRSKSCTDRDCAHHHGSDLHACTCTSSKQNCPAQIYQ